MFNGATLGDGYVEAVGGCAALGADALGLDGRWVRVAVLTARARDAGRVAITIESARPPYGVSIFARPGDLTPEALFLEGTTVLIEHGVSRKKSR